MNGSSNQTQVYWQKEARTISSYRIVRYTYSKVQSKAVDIAMVHAVVDLLENSAHRLCVCMCACVGVCVCVCVCACACVHECVHVYMAFDHY